MLSYEEATEYVDSLIDYEKRPEIPYNKRSLNLQRMRHLLSLLGNPHKNLKVVHIAGTKGKGTTSAIVASILGAGGFKVGLYTSPHLISPRERIRIGNSLIKEEEFAYFLSEIKLKIDRLRKVSPYLVPTFFEVYTALALLYFAYQNVDLAVLEVGLGGKLDATNVISPLVAVITQISFDHTKQLGNDLVSIAKEKASIIKKGAKVITSPQDSSVMRVIKERCRRGKASLVEVGKDVKFKRMDSTLRGQTFQIRTKRGDYFPLFLPLLGEHQIINAVTAVGAIELLSQDGIFVPSEAVVQGMRKVKWPGRVQVLSEKPLFLVDCAHNGASAQALASFLKEISVQGRIFLILGILKNKDVEGIATPLCPLADEVIITEVNSPRALSGEHLKKRIGKICHKRMVIKRNIKDALCYTQSLSNEEDLICVTGSVYLAGEALRYFNKEDNNA
jgi:dihydrofolate synthase/folylpolyglutamate synthase